MPNLEPTLSTDQWREAFAHVNALSELDVAGQRARLAEIAQTDADLARRVGQLLAPDLQPQAQPFTEVFAEKSSSVAARGLQAGDAVGAYTLEREIGKGGMADVWLGRRTDGTLNRPVAIKLPMAVLPSNVLAERFHRERNILAQLDHPHIARIYDAGTTAQGQPFLALEYIDGIALHDYCAQRRVDLRGRVTLTIAAAHALHHAHSRLILHRDIKPSNILVTKEGTLKLLDFGIAKLLDDDRTAEESQFTRLTGAALTPKYAAPEQLTNDTVTTATDVYGLGVVLFELLTGALPFGEHARDMAGRLKTLSVPPMRLTEATMDEAWAQRCGARSLTAYRRALAGDLAAIVSKSLRANASERYPSALAFAEDLQRTLDSRPVLARQGLVWYRLKKFVVRQKFPLAIAAAGALASAGFGLQALQNLQQANESAARAASINGLMQGLLAGMSPDVAKTRLFSAKELLDRANAYIETSKNNDPELVSRMGELYRDVGAYDEARKLFMTQRDAAQARNDFRGQIAAQLQLADATTKAFDLPAAQKELDLAIIASEKHLRAPDVLLAKLDNLRGQLASYRNESSVAKEHFARAEGQWRAHSPLDVEQLVWSLEGQALSARATADVNLARAKLDEVIALDLKYPVRSALDRARSKAFLGSVFIMDGRYVEARETLSAACTEHIERLGARHSETRVTCRNAAFSLIRTGGLDQAASRLTTMRAETTSDDETERAFIDNQLNLVAMYRGDLKEESSLRAYAQLVAQRFGGEKSDVALRAQRYVAEAVLRQGRKTEAATLLTSVVAEQIARHSAVHSEVAITQLLLILASIREETLAASRSRLADCVETLRATRGDHHHFTLSAQAYLALFSPTIDAAERTRLARRVQMELGWQADSKKLTDLLMSPSTKIDFARIPIVI